MASEPHHFRIAILLAFSCRRRDSHQTHMSAAQLDLDRCKATEVKQSIAMSLRGYATRWTNVFRTNRQLILFGR